MTDSVSEYLTSKTHKDNELGEILTFTGLYVYPMALTPAMVCIEDIAHALARVCRYAGHCHGFLSVAEHSVMVARIVMDGDQPEYALEALLHDASEAYLGDMPRPIKHLPEMQVYRDAEARAEAAIAEKFGLVYPMPDVVKLADRERLYFEMDNLRNSKKASTLPDAAERLFMAMYYTVMDHRAA